MKLDGKATPRRRTADGGLGQWIEITPPELAVHVLAQIAVAAVLRGDDQQLALGASRAFEHVLAAGGIGSADLVRFTDSVAARSTDWWHILATHAEPLEQERRDLIGLMCSTLSLVADECPVDGAGFRRTDAVLDLLNVDSSAAEIQRTVDAVIGELIGTPKSLTEQFKGLARTAQLGAEMLTITHPYIGIPAAWGLSRVSSDADDASDYPVDEIDAVLSIARTVTFVRNVIDDDAQRAETAERLREGMWNEARRLGWTGVELPRPASIASQAKGAWAVLRRREASSSAADQNATGLEGNSQQLLATCLVRAASLIATYTQEPEGRPEFAPS